jgi:hypothetical protein
MVSKVAPSCAKPKLLSILPEECWLKVFTHLEAAELSGCASLFCTEAVALTQHPQLWVSLLHLDFCASFAQQAVLKTWLEMHRNFHPRQLYIYKRREHVLELDITRAELRQRDEQAREQERKHQRLRTLNFVFVRVAHALLCTALLSSSILLWLRVHGVANLSFYTVFAPTFIFEVFMFAAAVTAYSIYFLRSHLGWTFYWNRLRGVVRWLILYTSPCESIIVLFLAASVVPLSAFALEGDVILPKQYPRFTLPFAAFWLTFLCFSCSLVRRRSFSAGCVGSFVLVWVPVLALSVLMFLKLSILPGLSPYAIFAPSLTMTVLVLLFVSFLVVASFWLGYRGNRDWTEYATVTLLTLVTLLLPLLLFQLAMLGYLNGQLSVDFVFLPWVLWLCCLQICALWYTVMPFVAPPPSPMDRINRPWRHPQDRPDSMSDTEQLLLLAPNSMI